MSNPSREELFEFLDDIREGGTINMFGAAPYVQEAFDLTKKQARDVTMSYVTKGLPEEEFEEIFS